jgi:hypothetical protein
VLAKELPDNSFEPVAADRVTGLARDCDPETGIAPSGFLVGNRENYFAPTAPATIGVIPGEHSQEIGAAPQASMAGKGVILFARSGQANCARR